MYAMYMYHQKVLDAEFSVLGAKVCFWIEPQLKMPDRKSVV